VRLGLDGPNSRLGLDDAAILVDEQTACALAPNTMKILWVVNSENYIYKRNSLNRAKKVGVSRLKGLSYEMDLAFGDMVSSTRHK
jgi:hypothetical protein